VACFAEATRPFFARDGAGFDEGLLAVEIDRLGRPEVLARWHEQFQGAATPIEGAVQFLVELLRERLEGTAATGLHRLAAETLAALLRLLLLGHPTLATAAALPTAEGRARALDAALVEVVYKFSRAIEHDADFVRRLHRSLDDTPGPALGVLLLKV